MQLDGDEEYDEEEVISLFLSSIVLHVKVLAAARTIMWHATIMMKVFIVKEEEEVKLLSGGGVLLALYYYLFELDYCCLSCFSSLFLQHRLVVAAGATKVNLCGEGLFI